MKADRSPENGMVSNDHDEPESPRPPLWDSLDVILSRSFVWALVLIVLLIAVLVGVFGTQLMSLLTTISASGQ